MSDPPESRLPTPAPDPDSDVVWNSVLDFVQRTAEILELSGWSLGVGSEASIHTYTRGFELATCDRYRVLADGAQLPGPVSLRTGTDHFFGSRREAHRAYPDAVPIDSGTRHDAAAVLVVRARRDEAAFGYLALHFDGPRAFQAPERRRLRALADSIGASVPRAGARSRADPGPDVSGRDDLGPRAEAAGRAMRLRALLGQ